MAGAELRGISPDASPEEVAAIVAAITAIEGRRAAELHASGDGAPDPQRVDHWRLSGRLAHRRVGMSRGPWRLSGRIERRIRA